MYALQVAIFGDTCLPSAGMAVSVCQGAYMVIFCKHSKFDCTHVYMKEGLFWCLDKRQQPGYPKCFVITTMAGTGAGGLSIIIQLI